MYLLRSLLLVSAAIFGNEQDNSIQDTPRAGYPCGEGGDGRRRPTSQLHTYVEGKEIEIRNILELGGRTLVWDHQFGDCGFGRQGFELEAAFFLDLLRPGLRLL